MTSISISSRDRSVAAAALVVAAAAHVPVTPEHLREAPYMGIAFIGFTLAALALGGWLTSSRSSTPLVAAWLLCAAAVATFVLTRVVPLPELADDVGNWTEPLALISIAAESVVLALTAQTVNRIASRRASSSTPRHNERNS